MTKKKCPKCKKTKELSEFYDGYKECKKCTSNRVQFNKKHRAITAVEKLLELGIIYNNEVSSAKTLYISCESRFNSCKYNVGIYKEIECEWESPLDFTIDIINKLPDFWNAWRIQNAIYDETKHDSDRPTIDRIDEFGNYTLSNIQMLSKHDNSKKAKAKPCKVLIIKNLRMLGIVEFDSKKEMIEKLIEANIPINAVKIKMDTGGIQEIGNGYSLLFQTKNGIVNPTDKPLYKMVIDRRLAKIDEETGQILEVLRHRQYHYDVGGIRI